MDIQNQSLAQIWRMLIPASAWMFPLDVPENELIFSYRDHIYFVNDDGSVLALPKPACWERLDLGTLLECLASSEETIDFDDNGEFDIGFVLKQMGYVVPTKKKREKASYQIEIVNTALPKAGHRYVLKHVQFVFALYHAVMRCHELNAQTDWEFEHEIKRIVKVEPQSADKVQANL